MSQFDSIPLLPSDPIFNLPVLFAADQHEKKVNLGIGSYKDVKGNPVVLACVHRAEQMLLEKQLNKEYLPIAGDPDYIKLSLNLIFNDTFPAIAERTVGLQSVGGTGGLRLVGDLLARNKMRNLFLPHMTWPNHHQIFSHAGLQIATYPYYDQSKHHLDFDALSEAIQQMPPSSVIVLHACCHNPTGLDPSMKQWQELSALIKKQKVIPLFDLAYQGFGVDLDEDAYAVRYFAQQGHEMFAVSSYAKNMGLYGERAGLVAFVGENANAKDRVTSHLKQIARSSYSNPPLHAARIVSTILSSEPLTLLWKNELTGIRERINEMRQSLIDGLSASGHEMPFLSKQLGIFAFLGLSTEQLERLRKEHGIYLAEHGRANIAGLNWANIDTVVAALKSVLD